MNHLIQPNFCRNDFLAGEEGDGVKRRKFFFSNGRRSYLNRVFLLEVCVWLKCRMDIDWLVEDVGEL